MAMGGELSDFASEMFVDQRTYEKTQLYKLQKIVNYFIATDYTFISRTGYPIRLRDISYLRELEYSDKKSVAKYIRDSPSIVPPIGHGDLSRYETSGSTGEATVVFRTGINQSDYLKAEEFTDFIWNRDSSKPKLVIHPKCVSHPITYFRDSPITMLQSIQKLSIVPGNWAIERYIHHIRQFKPLYIKCYPSVALEFARLSAENPDLFQFEGITLFGEMSEIEERREISTSLDSSLCDLYCSTEFGIVAFLCPESGLYHIFHNYLIVEVVNQNGMTCKTGEIGKVYVTDLHNYAIPYIRYFTGDYAEVGGVCSCGIHGMTLRRIVGRSRNLMTKPNGDLCWQPFGELFRSIHKIVPYEQYKIIQQDKFTLKVIFSIETRVADDELSLATDMIRKYLNYPYRVIFEIVDYQFDRLNGQKFEIFRNEVCN